MKPAINTTRSDHVQNLETSTEDGRSNERGTVSLTAEMCGKNICETAKKLAHNQVALNAKDDERTKESWWTKFLILQPLNTTGKIVSAGEHKLLQEGSVWIRNFSALKNRKDWRPLYFVLCAETLYYINKLTSPPTFSGAIAVKDISSIIPEDFPSDDGTDGHYVRVRTKSENFILHWRSMERRDAWLTSLLHAKAMILSEHEGSSDTEDYADDKHDRMSDLLTLCLPIPCKSQQYTDF